MGALARSHHHLRWWDTILSIEHIGYEPLPDPPLKVLLVRHRVLSVRLFGPCGWIPVMGLSGPRCPAVGATSPSPSVHVVTPCRPRKLASHFSDRIRLRVEHVTDWRHIIFCRSIVDGQTCGTRVGARQPRDLRPRAPEERPSAQRRCTATDTAALSARRPGTLHGWRRSRGRPTPAQPQCWLGGQHSARDWVCG